MGFLLKPHTYLLRKNPLYFPVRDNKLSQPSFILASLGQITSGKKDAPEVFDARVQIPVGQLLTDCLFDTAAVDQQFDLISDD